MKQTTVLPRRKTTPINVNLKRFVTKVITPVVLLAGLLLLALYHFEGVLKLTTAQQQAFQGNVVYSAGRMQTTFNANDGINRPQLTYAGRQLMTYADWSSSITINGAVQELWNNDHGYSVDAGRRQVFATTSGPGWQVIQVVTLVDDRTMTVDYQFAARPMSSAANEPKQVVLDIAHVEPGEWYQPHVQGSKFTATILPVDLPSGAATTDVQSQPTRTIKPLGTMAVTVTSAGTSSATPITLHGLQAITNPDGSQDTMASSLTTEYVVNHPQVDRVIDLGHETISFTPTATGAGTPISVPMALP